jgi:eukaryotic-like serine/threonine-protein kinase
MASNSIGMKLVWIPAGEFMMGSPSGESGRHSKEGPERKVTISKGFWLGQTVVTQGQYQAVMETNPSYFKGDDNLPVESVSWNDAMEFCKKLSQKEGKNYTLPTEAQWEYACRAGTTTAYSFGDNASQLDEYAWYGGNSGDKTHPIKPLNLKDRGLDDRQTHPVGILKPNAWGLDDMNGNVWEWCLDWCQDNYEGLDNMDPQGPPYGTHRILRGGSWSSFAEYCRVSYRYATLPYYQLSDYGFRVVLDF